jgi:hypothetical protein
VARGLLPLVVKGFEIVGEGVVAHIVEEAGGEEGENVLLPHRFEKARVAQEGEEVAPDGVIHAEGVFEARVHGAGIDSGTRTGARRAKGGASSGMFPISRWALRAALRVRSSGFMGGIIYRALREE